MIAVPALIAFSTACYGLAWVRFRATGTFRLLPDRRPLWLLTWAALFHAAYRLIVFFVAT